jgi:hypothetical protein
MTQVCAVTPAAERDQIKLIAAIIQQVTMTKGHLNAIVAVIAIVAVGVRIAVTVIVMAVATSLLSACVAGENLVIYHFIVFIA